MDNSILLKDIEHVLRNKIAILPGARDREGRPIIFVPVNGSLDDVNRDHLRNLLKYLFQVTADDARKRGFIFVIDMRKGTTWKDIKPILECLQDFFSRYVALVLILKPENFWRRPTGFSTGKYEFPTQTCSADGLTKHADANQILREFGGSLGYDHDEWMGLRDDVEQVEGRMRDMLSHFTHCAATMSDAAAPVDLETTQLAMKQHENHHILLAATSAVEQVDADVVALERRIFAGPPELAAGGPNPDLTVIAPRLRQRVKSLFATRIDVLNQWEAKKQELDQCYQLKSFENDVEMCCVRFRVKYDEIKRNFHDTGVNAKETQSLIEEFAVLMDAIRAEEVVYNQTMNNGRRLLKLYAANETAAALNGGNNMVRSIDTMLHQVDRHWHCLLQLAKQRKQLLNEALIVHEKCNKFLNNFNVWINNVGVNPDTITGESHELMKSALENHDNFHKQFESDYSEAYASATSLMKQMKKIFGELNAGQTKSYLGLVELINSVTMAKRQLHGIWKSRRETIECRMSNAAFFSDLRLVIEWLEVNGEPFLRRKIAIGHNYETAENLSRNHEQFRTVARSTYENAKQLFHIAQVLKNSGEVNSDAIAAATIDLRQRIDNFRKKIDMRTRLLFIASNFFLHYHEIMNWYTNMDERSKLVGYIPDSVELCEQNKEKLLTENDGTAQAFERVKHEYQELHDALKQQKKLLNVDNSDAIRHVEDLFTRIEACHMREKERWPSQRAHLNAASKVASFLHDCAEIKKQLLSWREDLNSLKHSIANKAEVIVHYHRQNTESVRTAIQDALNQMGEIVQLIQNMNLHLIIKSTQHTAEEAVTAATKELQFLEVKVMEIASEVTDRIEVQLQVTKLNKSVNEMMKVIQDYQNQLHRMNVIPGALEEANFAQDKHEHFRRDCEKLEKMLIELQQKCRMDVIIVNSSQYSVATNMIEQLRLKWSHLVGQMENRSKLLRRSIDFFICVNNVIPVADNMEKNFMNDRSDYCLQLLGAPLSTSALEKVLTQTLECLTMHVGRKEKFIKAITHAQSISDQLLKSIYRCDNATTENIALREAQVTGFKRQIQESKERILNLWFQRKMWIDQCHKIILLQLSATQINDQITEAFGNYSQLLASVEQLRLKSGDAQMSAQRVALLKEKSGEYAGLKAFVKEVRERASTSIQHISKVRKICVDAGHCQLIDLAEKCVKEAFSRIVGLSNQIELALKEASGELSDAGSASSTLTLASSASFASRRNATSDASSYGKEELSLDSVIEDNLQKTVVVASGSDVVASNEVNRKLIAPMNELIKTEKHYVEMLKIGVTVYLEAYRTAGSMCPQLLRNKETEIFGNIEELYAFHSNVFLPDLLDYERHPEDVGYCFIQWLERLKELYADYCLNKPESNRLIGLPEAEQFFLDICQQNKLPLSSNFPSVVIQPVQRIARYTLILEQLMKRSLSIKREMKEMFEAVSNIPKLANDRMHLKNFENAEKISEIFLMRKTMLKEHRVGDFVMQDAFVIFEPKRYFKRERDLQVFLFESNVVFTKREEIGNRTRYVYKDSMLLREIHVVEHVEGDNTKFGLRKENQIHQNDSTIILKTTNESNRMLWVKTLRNLKLDLKLESKKSTYLDTSSINSSQSGNRGSQISRDSNTSATAGGGCAPEDRFSVASTSSAASVTGNVIALPSSDALRAAVVADNKNVEQFFIGENFTANEEGQISVKIGQRVELINSLGDANGVNGDRSSGKEFVSVAVVDEETGAPGSGRGNVPLRILLPVVEKDTAADAPGEFREGNYSNNDGSISNANVSKRSSLRWCFLHNNTFAASDPSAVSQNNAATVAGQQLASSSANAVAGLQFTSASPTAAISGDTCPPVLVAEIRDEPASSSATQSQAFAADVDLPPPMSQLSSEPMPSAANFSDGAATTDSPFDPNSILMNDKRHESGSDSPPHGADSAAGTPQGGSVPQISTEESSRMKRSYVLNELVETERVYVQDLTSVVEGYIGNLSTMELPEDLRGKDKIIFANIAQILDFHKTTFLKDIEMCIENYEAVGHAFNKHERRLNTYYVKYCQNKPKSDFLVSQDSFEQFFAETKQKLGHKVALCDLLIKPIQRITKYQLMLSDILKYTHRAHDKADVLERALEVMRVVPKACDDMMQVGRLQNFEGNLTAQGRLLYQGTLQISDGPPSQPFRGKDRRVFLFEQSAIIADCIPPRKEYGNPTYIFKNQIMVNKMVLEDKVADEPTRFVLTSNDPSQPAVFVAQAASLEDKQQWLAKISAQLDQQKTFLAALVDPKKYQNQLASSVGALNLGVQKDSSGSLNMATLPGSASSTNNFSSPKHNNNNSSSTKSASKLFGFGKSKS